MRLTHLHPGVSVEAVQTKTGFPLEVSTSLEDTAPPTMEDVRLLREEIDPLGIRRLERLSVPARREALREILKREAGDPSTSLQRDGVG